MTIEANMKKITINGKLADTTSKTIAALIEELGIPPAGVAVAVNDEIVPRPQHEAHILNEGDIIEIIRPIGGG